MKPIETILVPVDFQEPSSRALAYAVALAARVGARVIALHAYELPIVGFPDGAMVITADVATRIINAAQKGLDDLVAKIGRPDVPLSAVLEQADARDAVLAVATRVGADLIVMGTHGRRGLTRALLGSVTESIVRTSPIPVLTLRGAEPT